jgi:hypothetical protein
VTRGAGIVCRVLGVHRRLSARRCRTTNDGERHAVARGEGGSLAFPVNVPSPRARSKRSLHGILARRALVGDVNFVPWASTAN